MKKKFKKNVKFLERMNQINQGNELYIISFVFVLFCFCFSLSGHLLLLDSLCYYYTCEGKKQTSQKI